MTGATHLTPKELAKRWSVHVITLANWRNKKKGPPYKKLGTSVRYAIDDVVKWENNNMPIKACNDNGD